MFRHLATAFATFAMLLLATICHAAPSSPQRVQEARFLVLGGIEQWVTIRGSDMRAPVLLVIHGGPGDVESVNVDQFAPYEAQFVVVQWDQRGAGKTFARYREKTPSLTVDRLVSDGVELATLLKQRFGRKVVLLGHSFGTEVAARMAVRRPDLFLAYVGTGQNASAARTREAQAEFVRIIANVSGDAQLTADLDTLAKVDATNPDQIYANLKPLLAVSAALRRHLGPADAAWLAGFPTRLARLTPAERSELDEGAQFSSRALAPETLRSDLFTSATTFEVPVLVIQGRDDLFSPTAGAIAWFDRVQAPDKQMTIIEDAGHFALVTNQQEFLNALLTLLGPITNSPNA